MAVEITICCPKCDAEKTLRSYFIYLKQVNFQNWFLKLNVEKTNPEDKSSELM